MYFFPPSEVGPTTAPSWYHPLLSSPSVRPPSTAHDFCSCFCPFQCIPILFHHTCLSNWQSCLPLATQVLDKDSLVLFVSLLLFWEAVKTSNTQLICVNFTHLNQRIPLFSFSLRTFSHFFLSVSIYFKCLLVGCRTLSVSCKIIFYESFAFWPGSTKPEFKQRFGKAASMSKWVRSLFPFREGSVFYYTIVSRCYCSQLFCQPWNLAYFGRC